MLLDEQMKRTWAIGPDRFVAIHIGEIHEGVLFGSRPAGLAATGIENHIHSRRNLLFIPEDVRELAMLTILQREFAKYDMATKDLSKSALILEEDKLLSWTIIPLNAHDSNHRLEPPTCR